MPGLCGLLLFEFLTGLHIKHQNVKLTLSTLVGFFSLFFLSYLNKKSYFEAHYKFVVDKIINSQQPISSLSDHNFFIPITLLIVISFFITITFYFIYKLIDKAFVKFLKRSINPCILFSTLNKYTKKTSEKEPVYLLVKLKTGNYIYGVFHRATDNLDDKYLSLLSCCELNENYKIIHYFNKVKSRIEDPLLVSFSNIEFIQFNVTETYTLKENKTDDICLKINNVITELSNQEFDSEFQFKCCKKENYNENISYSKKNAKEF